MTEARNGGALTGFKIVDLSRVLGGPLCTQLLGDHGADVIKVEPPHGDETRGWGPPERDGESAYYTGVNRNKRSIGLDLSTDPGREILLRMLADADMLIENFRIGTMERWGMDYASVLAPRFPRLIYCRISGFGADGPLGGMPGYDGVAQALSGLMSVNGSSESGPVRIGVAVIDQATGMNAAIAILAAAYERERSGRGQFIEVTLYDSGIALIHPQITNWFMSGEPPRMSGNSHPNVAPYDCYETGTAPLFVAALNNRQFCRLCAQLGAPDLARQREFASNADRVANRAALDERLATLFAETDGSTLYLKLLAHGVPAATINDVPTVLGHSHTRHRDMVIESGDYQGTGIVAKLDRTPGSIRRPPPRYSADGRDILSKLGYSTAEIDALADAGVLLEERREW